MKNFKLLIKILFNINTYLFFIANLKNKTKNLKISLLVGLLFYKDFHNSNIKNLDALILID